MLSLRPRHSSIDECLGISLGIYCLFDDPMPGRFEYTAAEQALRWYSQTPLIDFTPLRRIKTRSTDHTDVPPPAFASPMPILTASAIYSSFVPSGYHPGNDLGVLRWPSRVFPPGGARNVTVAHPLLAFAPAGAQAASSSHTDEVIAFRGFISAGIRRR